ncbi:MAG: hypothetical protein QOH62_1673 [Solirubrobacteraceae bacterium]|nr:hypothetical protein [Solirubrobacteraceae bacterium]
MLAIAAALAPAAAPAAVPGCAPQLPVVAHHAGGALASAPLPTACVTETGMATSESTIGVTRRGTVVYSPAISENSLARSLDGGATWSAAYPPDEQYTALWNTDDPYLTVDRRTGRIFWSHATGPSRTAPILVSNSPLPSGLPTAIAAAAGFQVYSSADEGASWHTADYQSAPTGDWEKVFTGPPAPGAAQPQGYPDVVYLCGNSPTEAAGPGRLCYRSLDGGESFEPAGYVFPSAQTPDSCQALAANNGAVGPDGTVYQPVMCRSAAYVAVSRDEGASYTWQRVQGAPGMAGVAGVDADLGGLQVAVDDGGTVYALWQTESAIYLTRSRDGAQHFTAPLSVAAPGLRRVALPALAAGEPGEVGVAYYGAPDEHATHLTAYLTQSADATASDPILVSAALNDPAQPVFQPSGVSGSLTPRADYVGAAYDAAGTLWGGLVKQLAAPDPDGHVGTTGLVGRLVVPPRAPGCATRRLVVFHLPRGSRAVRVFVRGRRARLLRGARNTVAVDLRANGRRAIRVRLTARSRGGRPIRRLRVVQPCRHS